MDVDDAFVPKDLDDDDIEIDIESSSKGHITRKLNKKKKHGVSEKEASKNKQSNTTDYNEEIKDVLVLVQLYHHMLITVFSKYR